MHVFPASLRQRAWIELTGRDAAPTSSSIGRWVAFDDAAPAGAIEVRVRPDGKAFLSVHGADATAHRLMIETARASLARPLYAVCGRDRLPGRGLLADLGFDTILIQDLFRVDFREAQCSVARAWVPSGHSIVSATEVDVGRLFELDNALRHLIPGTEDWEGDRAVFDSELFEAPPFDANGYLVGVDDGSGELLGLIRFWRNDSGPRLGMIGVMPSRRATSLGPALLSQGLDAASRWGSSHFTTETARTNRHAHRRLTALGAEVTGSIEIVRG